jgi:hypothetical protein
VRVKLPMPTPMTLAAAQSAAAPTAQAAQV